MLEALKKKYYIHKQVKRLTKEFNYCTLNLRYFENVRRTNFQRQEIGLKDLHTQRFYGVKKVSKIYMSSSTFVMLKGMMFYLTELIKLSRLTGKNFISQYMVEEFYYHHHKKYENKPITVKLLKEIAKQPEKVERKKPLPNHNFLYFNSEVNSSGKSSNSNDSCSYDSSDDSSSRRKSSRDDDSSSSLALTAIMASAVG